jgi:aspartyl-tRNA(Asn)/glutamyl-tRNA(Gln) amidotransferase subunit A
LQAVDLSGLSIARAAELIRAGEITPLELTDQYLRRIERFNPLINAYTTVTAARALADAERATKEIGERRLRGPLHGIPIGLKDLFATAGIRTTAGSKILADWIPETDSTVARKLTDAGTVLLGKLATHEFAAGATTNNPHYGPTRNPWDTERIPGGSSGGSGAAIAAGLAAGSLGTDTGGSIRIPASLCGVVGLKPTYGRVSKSGVVPLSYLFDHPGPITHTVEDAALMLGAIAGYDPDDPSTVRTPVDDYLAGLGGGVRGLTIGVPRRYFYERLNPEVAAAVETALDLFRGEGASVLEVEIAGIEQVWGSLMPIFRMESQHYHAPALAGRPDDFGPDLREILSAPPASASEIAAAFRACDDLTVAMRQVLEQVDVLLTPTTPEPAMLIGQDTLERHGASESVTEIMVRCTMPFNVTRLPVLALPCGFTQAGLPIGMQIAGKPFDEATLLRAGQAYEAATSWHLRRPPATS